MLVALPLDKMTVEEKLQTLETIWESLSGEPDAVASPAWHQGVLLDRQRQVECGEAQFSSWEQAQKNLRQRAAARNR